MPSVLAIAAHPDDIEFAMAGTMLQLQARGWDLHYMNLCDGSKGSTQLDPESCAATRRQEAKVAAERLGATFYPPIWRDMELRYDDALLRQVASVVRQTQASIVLTHAPSDYMEDHEYACRLAVSAAFTHGMPNYETNPSVAPYFEPVTVYHAQPHGNRTSLGQRVRPHFWVNIEAVIDQKEQALAAHACQQEWLDSSQGMNSYLQTMWDLGADAGQQSGQFQYAEGWRRREHWGFCGADDDPLRAALADLIVDDTPRDT
jgi:LmbE family N-acetylglucosaminyl deacetylase